MSCRYCETEPATTHVEENMSLVPVCQPCADVAEVDTCADLVREWDAR